MSACQGAVGSGRAACSLGASRRRGAAGGGRKALDRKPLDQIVPLPRQQGGVRRCRRGRRLLLPLQCIEHVLHQLRAVVQHLPPRLPAPTTPCSAHTSTSAPTRAHTDKHAHTHTHIHQRQWPHGPALAPRVCMCVCVYVCVCVRVCLCVCVRMHTHTPYSRNANGRIGPPPAL